MLNTTQVNPFTVQDLLSSPDLNIDTSKSWSGFVFETNPQNEVFALANLEQSSLPTLSSEVLKLDASDVELPSLETANDLPAKPSPENKDTIVGLGRTAEKGEEDFWAKPSLLLPEQEKKLVSWDDFARAEPEQPACTFVSEAGPAAFDLLLRKTSRKEKDEHIKYVKPDLLVSALFNLGLGRSSTVFQWSEQDQRFEESIQNYTTSGVSYSSLRHIINRFLDLGTRVSRLRRFAQSSSGPSPTAIALQNAIKSTVDAVEYTVELKKHSIRSLICLQDVYIQPFLLFEVLDHLIKEVRSIPGEGDLVTAFLVFIEQCVAEEPRFEHVMHNIANRTLRPVLRRIEALIAMKLPESSNGPAVDDAVSVLLSASTLNAYTETKHAIQLLNEHEQLFRLPERLSLVADLSTIAFNTVAVANCQDYAHAYENSQLQLITMPERSRPMGQNITTSNARNSISYESGDPFNYTPDLFNDSYSLDIGTDAEDVMNHTSLQQAVMKAFSPDTQASTEGILSCRQAVNLAIGPWVEVQHRLVSYLIIRLLFQDQDLLSYVELQGRFPMLSDGFFTSRLSASLFDPDQTSGEGSRRLHGKTGLRLQSRETWPPASSELRLALVGILSESMSNIQDTNLTDTISFAIRDLDEQDLERCRDIDSIYALDFLTLTFKSPNTMIEAVITTQSLDKYDAIFNQLLRLLRMKTLTESMLRRTDNKNTKIQQSIREYRFRLEALQFVSTLGEYFQNVVIRTHWSALETKLRSIKERVEHQDYSGTLRLANSLDHLREMHDHALDQILRGLFLKRRQSEAKGTIDRLFEVILRFAAASSKPSTKDDANSSHAETVSRLLKDFQAHIKALVQWLKIECGRAGNDGSDMFEQLLLKLDWNGYWSK